MARTDNTGTLEYWKAGSEERQLRIFISHRHDGDAALYDGVIDALTRELFAVQDMSLSAAQVMAGPRGGDLDHLEIQAEVAARIYTSDVLIAPSRPAVTRSPWVTWEVQLAAVGYAIPILFVDEPGLQRRTSLVSQVEALGLPHAVCPPEIPAIASSVVRLVGHPDWGIRQDEPDAAIRYRGPPKTARDAVLAKFPFRARLQDIAVQRKPSLWDRMTGKT